MNKTRINNKAKINMRMVNRINKLKKRFKKMNNIKINKCRIKSNWNYRICRFNRNNNSYRLIF